MGSGVAAALLAQHSLAELAPSLELTPPKKNSDYTVSIIFKDGTKALCSLDADNYKALVRIMY